MPEAKPDLILLDVSFRWKWCGNLPKAARARLHQPIIMLTAQNVENDMAVALEADANDYIVKPMRMGELLARVRSQLYTTRPGYDKVLNFWPQLCSS